MHSPINLHLHRALLVKKNIHILASYLTVFFTGLLADRFLMNILAKLCKKLQFFPFKDQLSC